MATIAQLKGWDSEEVFNVDGEILNQFSSIKELFGNADASNSEPLSLPNVSAATFQKVIEWCKHHKDDPSLPPLKCNKAISEQIKDVSDWDREFLHVDQKTLCELILAAGYLGIDGLFRLTCKTVADMISGTTSDENNFQH
ncbi:SKP1 [Bugula neritina]|uniref:SKP1 n=1 Tax=Bugula neritina TaxID=10212 RepID=A0A7J7JXC8_BUGNE|nr:SKP1 [Bugula neritina]